MRFIPVIVVLVSLHVLSACSIGAATRVLFNGLPEKLVPTQRHLSLTIYGGEHLNSKSDSDQPRPLRVCVYIQKSEDWSPPIDLSLPCIEHDEKLIKGSKLTLLADRVASLHESVPYQETAWITVTGDFSDLSGAGRTLLKLKSPSESDSCHWVHIDRNRINEISKINAGNQPACK